MDFCHDTSCLAQHLFKSSFFFFFGCVYFFLHPQRKTKTNSELMLIPNEVLTELLKPHIWLISLSLHWHIPSFWWTWTLQFALSPSHIHVFSGNQMSHRQEQGRDVRKYIEIYRDILVLLGFGLVGNKKKKSRTLALSFKCNVIAVYEESKM